MNDAHGQDDGDELLIATFALADGSFGLDTALIQEVVKAGELTPVHDAPAYVAGIRNLRGRIVTVIDLRIRLGFAPMETSPSNRILIADWKGEPVGLLVDSVSETVAVRRSDLQPPPAHMGDVQVRNLQGMFRSGQRLPALLDPRAVLDPEEGVTTSNSEVESR